MKKTNKDIRFNRERFEMAAKYYGQEKIGIVPQNAQIVCVAPFVATSNGVYKFDVKKDPSIAHVIEQLLKRNDLFIGRAIGLALMVEANASKGTAPLLSYPLLESTALPTGIKGFSDLKPYAIYKGYLTMKTGQSVNYSRLHTAQFLYVPETQPVALWNGAAAISAGIQPAFSQENILVELPEIITLAGTKEQPITLEFPATVITVAADHTAYAVLVIEGWLLEGGANPDYAVDANPFNGKF